LSRKQDPENPTDFTEYCARRGEQDDDLWILELDVSDGEIYLNEKPA
jgi:hypothetical protein